MPIQSKPTKFARYPKGKSLTEQEHKDSCDINKMLRGAKRGQLVRGRNRPPTYGVDDTTLDGLSHRIQKQELEEELRSGPQEFPQEVLDKMPASVKKKFGFKASKKSKSEAKNDDKTTKNAIETDDKKQADPPKTSDDESEGFDYR